MSFRRDVLGLGITAVDHLLSVDSFPAPESKTRVARRERRLGGVTAVALAAASRLGARCAYAGVLGEDDDEDSRFVLDALAAAGIDVAPARRRAGAGPVVATVIVDRGSHTRTILLDDASARGVEPEAIEGALVRTSRVLLVDHLGFPGMLRAARIARESGLPVVADFERGEGEAFDELLALVDHLILGERFALAAAAAESAEDAADRLWNDARAAVIITLGERGCLVRERGAVRPRRVPAFAVETADTTGCGDVFHGAYCAALARGAALEERIRLATAAAAIRAMRPGATPGTGEIEAFLRSRE